MLDAFIGTLNHTRSQTLKLVADLSETQMTLQPAPKTNHPAWVLGHLLAVDISFCNLIGADPGPTAKLMDDAWKNTYGGGSQPVADASVYKSKAFYLEKMADVRERILARLKSMPLSDLEKPHPDESRRARFPTIYHVIVFYGTYHEAYHGGQLSAWRRVQGMPAV